MSKKKNKDTETTTDSSQRYDETVADYVAHGDERPAPHKPSNPHAERLESGEVVRVIDPNEQTFSLDHEAPLMTPEDAEVEQELLEAQRLGQEAEAPHMETIQQDMATDQAVQDEYMSESELIDSAPIRQHFNKS